MIENPTPMETAIALSLYNYNVAPYQRALAIVEKLGQDEGYALELNKIMSTPRVAFAATELTFAEAKVFVNLALEKYGQEARDRIKVSRHYPSYSEAPTDE